MEAVEVVLVVAVVLVAVAVVLVAVAVVLVAVAVAVALVPVMMLVTVPVVVLSPVVKPSTSRQHGLARTTSLGLESGKQGPEHQPRPSMTHAGFFSERRAHPSQLVRYGTAFTYTLSWRGRVYLRRYRAVPKVDVSRSFYSAGSPMLADLVALSLVDE